jgi:glycerol-3-phosphate dehydrogenase
VLSLEDGGAPLLNVFGGKITTYRRLAEAALAKLRRSFPRPGRPGRQVSRCPGVISRWMGSTAWSTGLRADYPFLDAIVGRGGLCAPTAPKRARSWGMRKTAADLGRDFGATLTEAEVRWLMTREFARTRRM